VSYAKETEENESTDAIRHFLRRTRVLLGLYAEGVVY
jgi:hypothetical protein